MCYVDALKPPRNSVIGIPAVAATTTNGRFR
ncbi:MAG: hypothetical protein ACI9UK_001972, partial [Candidatus Krumholzibacteriia bacterium]